MVRHVQTHRQSSPAGQAQQGQPRPQAQPRPGLNQPAGSFHLASRPPPKQRAPSVEDGRMICAQRLNIDDIEVGNCSEARRAPQTTARPVWTAVGPPPDSSPVTFSVDRSGPDLDCRDGGLDCCRARDERRPLLGLADKCGLGLASLGQAGGEHFGQSGGEVLQPQQAPRCGLARALLVPSPPGWLRR